MKKKVKKILIIDGHPDKESFCADMAKEYYHGAKDNNISVKLIKIRKLKFDPILHFGYRKRMELEDDLIKTQEAIKECNHLVLILPVWWTSMPAELKGFFDRCFLSGFSHRFNVEKKVPEKLLKGRSATVLYTQGGPKIYSKLFLHDAFWIAIKKGVLKFAGFSPVKRKCFDKVKSGNDKDRKQILETVYKLGKKGF